MPACTRGRKNFLVVYSYACFVLLSSSCGNGQTGLKVIKQLDRYPSGSGLAFHRERLYIVGDDAGWLMVSDVDFNRVDSITLLNNSQYRIAKDLKPDFESIALAPLGNSTNLLLTGSGSLAPRNKCYLIDPVSKTKSEFSLDTLYERLRTAGIRDLNIEGATALNGEMILAHRGNKSFPENKLIVMSSSFWQYQANTPFKVISVQQALDTASFAGISGLDYLKNTDQLFITSSTEDTYNSYDDGRVGKSYLWIINRFTEKKELDVLRPDTTIDLEKLDSRFRNQKIESVCIISQNSNRIELVLVADDDKGGTVLSRLVLSL